MSVRETIRRELAQLTTSERKIGNAVLADYPFGGAADDPGACRAHRRQRPFDHPLRQQDRLRRLPGVPAAADLRAPRRRPLAGRSQGDGKAGRQGYLSRRLRAPRRRAPGRNGGRAGAGRVRPDRRADGRPDAQRLPARGPGQRQHRRPAGDPSQADPSEGPSAAGRSGALAGPAPADAQAGRAGPVRLPPLPGGPGTSSPRWFPVNAARRSC